MSAHILDIKCLTSEPTFLQKNPQKDIDKNTNYHVWNETKRYWLGLHFMLDGQYICTRDIGLEYVRTYGTKIVCTVIL